MKLFIKNNIKFIIVIVICLIGSSITTLATNYIFNSNEVSYDNTESGLHADEVQGAIDEVFQHATDYSEIKNTIGTGSFTTTSNTLIGGVNELNGKLTTQEDEGVYYGTCGTAAGTQQKAVTSTNFPSALKAGQKLRVKFTNAQTYNGQPTLKVNTLAVANICKFGTTAAARYEWQAGQVLDFIYDGSNWIIVDGQQANGNYPGKVKLSDAYTSSGGAASAGVGASSKAVYDAYTALNSKIDDVHQLEAAYLTSNKTANGSYVTVLSETQSFEEGNYLVLAVFPFTIPAESGQIKIAIGNKSLERYISTFGTDQYVAILGPINGVASGSQLFSLSIKGTANNQAKVYAYNAITVIAKRI